MKAIVFYPLLWLRSPILVIARMGGGFFALGGVAWAVLTMADDTHTLTWGIPIGLFVTAFVLFLLNRLYDQLLLKLNPHKSDLVLFQ